MRAVTLAACLVSVCFVALTTTTASAYGDVFAILQDTAGVASVVVYNATADVKATSPLHWNFRWPVTEVTVNTLKKQVSVITFPNPTGQATLFTFDFGLGAPVNTQVSSDFSYFDLQFSPKQNVYYGIAVSSAYGRVLSKFTDFNEPVAHTPIQALPYMWYVNASTFDIENSRYYSLINNFPGFPNSTNEQMLAIGHFGESTPRVEFVKLTLDSGVLIRFIAYSNPTKRLFAFANVGAYGSAAILELDPVTGQTVVCASYDNLEAQPLYASLKTPTLQFFAYNTASQRREFIRVRIGSWMGALLLRTFAPDNQRVVAVAELDE